VSHLYPPDKGWVRLDPASGFNTISLVDLAIMVEDPPALATMLMRLTDDEVADGAAAESALAQKFTDVTNLFGAVDPRLARTMFARLARAVLDLDPERRKELLRRTILPGLLDGRPDGNVLKDFPDLDLADSLCLLLDLETAAPEVLSTALERLELTAERRAAVVPLLESRLDDREPRAEPADGRTKEAGIDGYARKLIRIDHAGKSFAEFSAFDLSLDEHATTILAQVRDGIDATDIPVEQLRCLSSLVRIEPNPGLVEKFLDRSSVLLADLERASRWPELASWVSRYRQLAESLREPRPDVADTICVKLAGFCTPNRVRRLVELYEAGPDGRTAANQVIDAFGVSIAPSLVAALEDRPTEPKARGLVQLMCDHAKLLAPALVLQIGQRDVMVVRALVRVLGAAGAGYETAIADQLRSGDEQTVREGFRVLARIGTARAAAFVTPEIVKGSGWLRGAAEEALWHFPKAEAERQVRELLGRRDFVLRHPQVVGRLLDRAAQAGASGLQPALIGLVPLRFRFWNPALVRVALKARALLNRT
jgi:hypothetical protein